MSGALQTPRSRSNRPGAWLSGAALAALALAVGCVSAQGAAAAGEAGVPFRWASGLPAWASRRVFGIALWQIGAAFVLVLGGLVCRRVFDLVMERKLLPLFRRTRFEFDSLLAEAAGKPLSFAILLTAIAAALSVLPLPVEPNVRGFVGGAVKVFYGVLLVWFLFRIVDVLVHYLQKLASRTGSGLDDQLVPVIRKALKITIGLLCGVWTVQLLGYNVSSLIAGLGIGGLAVALALQDALGNFFGSIVILLDRPFKVGDLIRVEGVEGFVEQIGFRSTRIRTWPASQVSIPNKTIANSMIDNWSRMPKRQVNQVIGVTYETSADEMERAVAAIRRIIENDPGVAKDLVVVRFTDFGDSSLNIQVLYYTSAVTLPEHYETKERINLAVMRALDEMGLSIAFPTRSIYLEGEAVRALAERVTGAQDAAGQAGGASPSGGG